MSGNRVGSPVDVIIWMRPTLVLLLLPLLTASPTPYDSSHHSECPDMRGVLPSADTLRSLVSSFVEGLREGTTQSQCYNATVEVVEGVVGVYRNVGEIVTGNTTLILQVLGSYGKVKDNFEDVLEDCDFSNIWEAGEKLLSPMGATVLFMRYSSHQDLILSGLSTLSSCSADLSACGRTAGELLRVMLDWGL